MCGDSLPPVVIRLLLGGSVGCSLATPVEHQGRYLVLANIGRIPTKEQRRGP
jgi:hypothetical protein